MDVNERIFKAAFTSLRGQPANTESFRIIARACVRCAAMWVDGFAQFASGQITDDQIVAMIADIAREELADLRQSGDRLRFKMPRNSLQ